MPGLYLHIPFCRQKCGYCDFFSIPADRQLIDAYPALLLRHLHWGVEQGWRGPIETVYFGGGTPSLLQPRSVAELLGAIDRHLGLAGDAEISLEANPDSLNAARLAELHRAGINRLSLGLQSLDDQQLRRLGRQHDRQAGLQAVQQARQAGFDNLALDLMFALPGQTPAQLDAELQEFLELAPEHLSCYGLTAEPGTPLGDAVERELCVLPTADAYADAFLQVHDRLSAAGYEHYEIANYARPGSRCRHNLGYWQRRPCFGLGAGAHSFDDFGWGSRWAVPADLDAYQAALSRAENPARCLEHFDREGALRETVYLALRTADGLNDAALRKQFGVGLAEAFPHAVVHSRSWLTGQDGHYAFTPSSWLLFDRLIQAFL